MTSTKQQADPSAQTPYGTLALPDRSTLSSEPFEILTESGGRFFIHSDILAAQSEPFRQSITGPWKESIEKKIGLCDWDSDTVGRLIEFLYFGQYRVPASDDGGGREGGALNGGNTVQGVASQEEWVGVNVGIDALLAHAKVYALAQYKAVEGLKIMALERLRIALEELSKCISTGVTSTVTANTIKLLEYVYSHVDSPTNSDEPMRALVLGFVAKNFQALMEWEGMRTFLSERGDLAVELMVEKGAYDLARICCAEKEARDWRNQAEELRMEAQDWKDQVEDLKMEVQRLRYSAASGKKRPKY